MISTFSESYARGRVTLKASLGTGVSTGEQFKFPNDKSVGESVNDILYPPGRFFVKSDFYVFPYLAVGADVGLFYYYFNNPAIVSRGYGREGLPENADLSSRLGFLTLPISISGKFNPAPFGPVNPYFVGGYNYSYAHSFDHFFGIESSHGPFVGGGVEIVTKDKIIYSLDIRANFTSHDSFFEYPVTEVHRRTTFSPREVTITFGIGTEL